MHFVLAVELHLFHCLTRAAIQSETMRRGQATNAGTLMQSPNEEHVGGGETGKIWIVFESEKVETAGSKGGSWIITDKFFEWVKVPPTAGAAF